MLKIFTISLVLMLSSTLSASNRLVFLKNGDTRDWESKSFVDKTLYRKINYKGRTAVRAISDSTASGLILKRRIDLLETPHFNWSWLITNTLTGVDETTKAGDDYPARVYVVLDGGLLLWKTKALTYVWSSHQEKGSNWDNAFAGANAKMIAIRGPDDELDHWYDERRNVYEDLISFFGDKGSTEENEKSYRYIDAVVIMTDTDNSGGRAVSYYGDIMFDE